MGMASGGGGGGLQSEINVTPMVDIMLVLLIIFMVVTPMLQHGVTVNLPKDLNNPEEDQRIIKDNSIVIVEDFKFEGPKTKQYISMLKSLGVDSKKTLLVLPENNTNVAFSGRNIQNTKVITASQINTYDVVNAEKLILVESSVGKIDTLLNK